MTAEMTSTNSAGVLAQENPQPSATQFCRRDGGCAFSLVSLPLLKERRMEIDATGRRSKAFVFQDQG
jgi:hypothetical protein